MGVEDQTLLTKAREFDEGALETIYQKYSDSLFKYAVRKVGDPARAEDFVAETFQRFLQSLAQGGGPKEYLRAYLYRITHNIITDFYRRSPPPPMEFEEARYENDSSSPPEVLAQKIKAETLRRALLRLTPGQQQVVILKFVEGFSNAEIARVMGKSVGAVKSQQHRAIASLQRILEGE